MSQELLLTACEQAERSETAVRAAALMHIARVMAGSDQVAAEQLLERGIALAKQVDGDATSLLLRNPISLAAAVSAKRALQLYAEHRMIDPFGGSVVSLVKVLAQHGHIDDAITYLRNPLPGDGFPLHFVNNLERECHDDETRRGLLELAIREWRNPAPREAGPEEQFAGLSFTALFGRYRNLLQREMATPVARLKRTGRLGSRHEVRATRIPTHGKSGRPEAGLGSGVRALQISTSVTVPRTRSGALCPRSSSPTC
jgi:hypothetical protein